MKRLVIAVAVLAMSVSMSFAQNANTSKEPFTINFNKLSTYLELEQYQLNEVASITDFFTLQQQESMNSKLSKQEKRMHQAVFGNLKLMKKALTSDQYRKYVALLNLTNNNNEKEITLADSFLAEK